MTWAELRSQCNRRLRPDTEILAFHIRGDSDPDTLIVWMTPRTWERQRKTVAIISSPEIQP